MTKQEAIGLIMNISAYDIDNQRGMEKQEALDMAIKALEQQPCEDYISRQAVKDWFCTNYCSEHNKCKHFEKGDCNSMNELYSLPFVTPQKWIPVSERLPEDNENVLMTIRRMDGRHNDYPFVSVGYIGWNQQSWWCAHDGDCAENHVEVLAWMPLPEPYKAESEET